MNHEPVIVLLITGRFKNDEDLIAAVIISFGSRRKDNMRNHTIILFGSGIQVWMELSYCIMLGVILVVLWTAEINRGAPICPE